MREVDPNARSERVSEPRPYREVGAKLGSVLWKKALEDGPRAVVRLITGRRMNGTGGAAFWPQQSVGRIPSAEEFLMLEVLRSGALGADLGTMDAVDNVAEVLRAAMAGLLQAMF